MIPRVEHPLREGIAALDELGLRYAVVGGLAVGVGAFLAPLVTWI